MFAAFLTTHNSYLHSWGTILVQDVIIPLRGKQLTPKRHLLYLRLAILSVGIFIYLFSLLFRQTQHILLYTMISGAIWTGGAGSVIVGGLYWKRGSTVAAYSAIIVGAVVAIAGLVLDQVWQSMYETSFPLGFKWISALSMVSALAIYVIVSLRSKGPAFDLDRMLHRGKCATEDLEKNAGELPKKTFLISRLKSMLGINEGLTLHDKVIYAVAIGYHSTMFGIFLFMTLFAIFVNLPDKSWADFFRYFLAIQLLTSFIVAVWLTWGGFRDLKKMFVKLRTIERNDCDDGTVADRMEK